MAITIYTAEDFKFGLLKVSGFPGQAAWGTHGADGLDALELNVESAELDEDIQFREGNSAYQASREDDKVNHYADTYGAAPTLTYKAPVGVLKDELPLWLYLFFQNVSEAATTPYAKTFTFPTTQPDFSASAGIFVNPVIKSPVASVSLKIKDMIGENLKFSISPGDFLTVEQKLVGRGAVTVDSNPSGTWARSDVVTSTVSNRFHYNSMNMTIDFGAGAVSIDYIGEQSFEFMQTLTKVSSDSGAFETFALSERKGTFNFNLLYDANARSALANARNATRSECKLRWGNATPGTVERDLEFTLGLVFKQCKELIGDGKVYGINCTGSIVADAANSKELATVICADAQDWGW